MARILSIDFGVKRSGLAVTDSLQTIASGLATVPTDSLISFLKTYTAEEDVELFVIGQPKQKDGSPSTIEAQIQGFIKKLSDVFPQMPIKRVDERFTSKMAFQAMIDSGLKRKQRQNKSLIDKISATIILQTYLVGH